MEELLEYEGLVYSIVGKYTNYFDKDDLYQVGMLGLIDARNNFDDSRGVKFSTFAYFHILGKVKKYVRESNLVRVSSDLVKVNASILKAKEKMSQMLGREATIEEISLFLEIDVSKIEEAMMASIDVRSLDYSSCDDSVELYNSVSSFDKEMDLDSLNLKVAVENLADEERELIKARYYDDLTQAETSKVLGISQVQVSRKEGKILQKLKSVA